MTPGEIIADKYCVLRVLGEGGMGVVAQARHTALGTSVAIKVMRSEFASDPEAVARFEREARAVATLRNPHVVRIFDVGRTNDGAPYLVMEYLEGHDLAIELARRGPLPVGETVDRLLQACDAIAEAHAAGIIHRDLKPQNLFVANDNRQTVVKVLDFGISKVASLADAHLTQTQASLGTPLYMSPEQIRSSKSVDPRTDVWSFGVILYELLAGKPPFYGETLAGLAVVITVEPHVPIRSRRSDVSPELEAVIDRALRKRPEERFATVSDFADALRSCALADTEWPAAASVTTSTTAQPSPRRRSRALWPVAGAALIVVAGVVVAFVSRARETLHPPLPEPSATTPPMASADVSPSGESAPTTTAETGSSAQLAPAASASVPPGHAVRRPVRGDRAPRGAPSASTIPAPPGPDRPAFNE